tara:strand:+ start:330 stop:1304 length:975 start_codon:yes stop_codon:yes gene_type:complete
LLNFVPFVNPKTLNRLKKTNSYYEDYFTHEKFPIRKKIPRFCVEKNYSESFGYQWNTFREIQLDSKSSTDLSFQRFYTSTGWDPKQLEKDKVLEVGSGAGRFTEVYLSTTNGLLHSIDLSIAVEANLKNNALNSKRLCLSQASIYEIPFENDIFDKVFCFGVLQHTPSFSKSIISLIQKTTIGGEIVVDFYPINGWYSKINSKYILRPLTKRLPPNFLLRLIRANIRWMIAAFDLLCFLNLKILTRFIPITDLSNGPSKLNSKQRRERAIMDTFDAFSPAFDNPQRIKDVEKMFNSNGCEVTFAGIVKFHENSFAPVVRAIRKK